MTTRVLRKIIKIDEEKCNGCGVCVPACVEGALQIIDGKARLISETYCDGLGACLGECPQGAITIEEREAEGFDEEATKQHMASEVAAVEPLPYGCSGHTVQQFEAQAQAEAAEPLPCGCPGHTVQQFEAQAQAEAAESLPCGCPGHTIQQFEAQAQTGAATPLPTAPSAKSTLGHWPVQLTLVPPGAPFLQGADLLLVADCVPFAYAGFHQDLLSEHALLVACPKLDDFQAHQQKLTQILRQSGVKSITVVHMEVPCCSGLVHMAQEAIRDSGRDIPFKEMTIGVRGEIIES